MKCKQRESIENQDHGSELQLLSCLKLVQFMKVKIVQVFLSMPPAPIQSNKRVSTVYERKVHRERSTSWRNSKADAIQISSSQDNDVCLD